MDKELEVSRDFLMERRSMDNEVRDAIRTLYLTSIHTNNGKAA